jgi:hypothetical protein
MEDFCRKIFSDKNEIKGAIWRGNFSLENLVPSLHI